jgi:CubicO group peptidase (beta-lactamase class C family)
MQHLCKLQGGLWLGLVLSATSAIAAVNQTFTFNDTTAPQAVDRMFRDGVPSTCTVPGTPALFGSASTYSYQTQTFFNNGPARCVTVTVTSVACTGINFIGVNAYAPSVTPATRTGATWIGDGGSSPNPSITFSFNAPGSSPVVLWIDRSNAVGTAGLVNCDYTIQSLELDGTAGPPGVASTIPTLSDVALVLLALMLGTAAFLRQRARRA